MKCLLTVDKPPTCAGEWVMPPGAPEVDSEDPREQLAVALYYWWMERHEDQWLLWEYVSEETRDHWRSEGDALADGMPRVEMNTYQVVGP